MSPTSTLLRIAPRRPWRLALLLLAALAICPPAVAQDEEVQDEEEPFREVIDLKPDDLASFGVKNVSAPLGSLFRGVDHYY